jgi:hypothetical protein
VLPTVELGRRRIAKIGKLANIDSRKIPRAAEKKLGYTASGLSFARQY